MNKLKYAVSGVLSAIFLLSGAHVIAQPATLTDCQAIQDREARHDCYDRWDAATGVLRPALPAGASAAPAPRAEVRVEMPAQQRVEVPAQEKDEGSLFSRIFHRDADAEPAAAARGVTASTQLEHFGTAQSDTRIVEGTDGELAMIDRIAALDQSAPYVWVITLEGGQTWQQTTSKRYNLEKGDEVRIYPTRWGQNYRLSSENAGGYIQVQRVH